MMTILLTILVSVYNTIVAVSEWLFIVLQHLHLLLRELRPQRHHIRPAGGAVRDPLPVHAPRLLRCLGCVQREATLEPQSSRESNMRLQMHALFSVWGKPSWSLEGFCAASKCGARGHLKAQLRLPYTQINHCQRVSTCAYQIVYEVFDLLVYWCFIF